MQHPDFIINCNENVQIWKPTRLQCVSDPKAWKHLTQCGRRVTPRRCETNMLPISHCNQGKLNQDQEAMMPVWFFFPVQLFCINCTLYLDRWSSSRERGLIIIAWRCWLTHTETHSHYLAWYYCKGNSISNIRCGCLSFFFFVRWLSNTHTLMGMLSSEERTNKLLKKALLFPIGLCSVLIIWSQPRYRTWYCTLFFVFHTATRKWNICSLLSQTGWVNILIHTHINKHKHH